MSNPSASEGMFSRWLRATALGWVLGLGVVVALSLLSGMFGGEGEFAVGVGIGAGVGYAQGRILREWLGDARRWVLASTSGMGALFVVHDVLGAAGVDVPFSLPGYVVAGALMTGLWQSSLLGRVTGRAKWWVAACLAGWGLPAAAIAFGDSGVAGALGDVASLGALFFGGLMLGAPSGAALVSMLRRPTDWSSKSGRPTQGLRGHRREWSAPCNALVLGV